MRMPPFSSCLLGRGAYELFALTIAAQADLVIFGDKDPLVLQQFKGILIPSLAQAAAQLGTTGKT